MRYIAPVDEVIAGLRACTSLYRQPSDLDVDVTQAILEEAGAFAQDTLFPLDSTMDDEGASFRDGQVKTASGHREAYQLFCDGGWMGLSAPEEQGGHALPQTVMAACQEFWHAGSLAFAMGNLLTIGAIETLNRHASASLRKDYLPKLVSGEWAATMALTEPGAGSDLSTVNTRAQPDDSGRYLVRGNKIFISYGEHDLTQNIVHLVLARLPEAPQGSRGLSLFLVPKLVPADSGSLVDNQVRCTGIEHKLGQHGSPTCSLSFGTGEGSVGWLVGEPNRGLQAMFTMMNSARLAVAMQGVGVAERSTQAAAIYAMERTQGIDAKTGKPLPISKHPDMQRMLMTMRASTTMARLLALSTADAIDRAHSASSEAARSSAQVQADILTPIAKSYCTQTGIDTADLAIQVHGGMGYVEETGVARLWRDVRVTSIYEGTNGIQAIDLLTRKISGARAEAFQEMLDEHEKALKGTTIDNTIVASLQRSLQLLRDAATSVSDVLPRAPEQALSVATPFLKLCALALGASMVARLLTIDDDQSSRARTTELLGFITRFIIPETAGLASLIEGVLEDNRAERETNGGVRLVQ